VVGRLNKKVALCTAKVHRLPRLRIRMLNSTLEGSSVGSVVPSTGLTYHMHAGRGREKRSGATV
jgi:hypothetical protein